MIPVEGDLIVCETWVAYARHLRILSSAGPKYGGAADTLALCGVQPSWDTKEPIEAVRQETRIGMRPCVICFEKAKLPVPK